MKNRNLFVKIVFIVLIALLLLSLVVPVIFSQAAPRKENLLNGLKVLMWSDAKADKVSVKVRVHAGSAFDPQGREGVMQMLADNLFPNEAAREFFTEDLGGSLEVVTTYDYIQVDASSKPDQFLTMLETLSGAISNPPIDKETTTKLRTAQIARVKALESDPAYVADRAVAKRLFGTFPYGRPQLGTEASLQKIEYADLVDARQRFLTADNATIAVSGNFDRSLALRAIKRYFGSWLKADKKVPSTFRQPDEPPPGLLTIPSPKPETIAMRFAVRGVARSDKELASARIVAAIIENRLNTRVSSASVRSEENVLPGMITIAFAARMDADVVAKTLADVVTEAEFQSSRAAVSAHWANSPNESFWLDSDTYKTTSVEADRKAFDNVTLADVRAFADKLKAARMVAVLIGPPV